jgi:hypothetical protein
MVIDIFFSVDFDRSKFHFMNADENRMTVLHRPGPAAGHIYHGQ